MLILTPLVAPPGVALMVTPGALPYSAEAKLGEAVLTRASLPTVAVA